MTDGRTDIRTDINGYPAEQADILTERERRTERQTEGETDGRGDRRTERETDGETNGR